MTAARLDRTPSAAARRRAEYAALRDEGLDRAAAAGAMNLSDTCGRNYERFYLLDHPEAAREPGGASFDRDRERAYSIWRT